MSVSRKTRKMQHAIRCKPKGKFVCDWCWKRFSTETAMNMQHLGSSTLCGPCMEFYKDMIMSNIEKKEELKKDLWLKAFKMPGINKGTTQTLLGPKPRLLTQSWTIVINLRK